MAALAVSYVNPWKYWRPIYKYTWAFVQRSSYRHFAAYTQKLSAGLVVDLGTGTGEYIHTVARGHRYLFSDVEPRSLQLASKRAQACLPGGSWSIQLGDAESVIARAPRADVVSVIHVISVVNDPHALVAAALENLRPGGCLLIYISRFSGCFRSLCNPLIKRLGFRLIDVESMLPHFRKEAAGWLNYCYVVEKAALS